MGKHISYNKSSIIKKMIEPTFDIIREISAEQGSNAKKSILERERENEVLKKILFFVFNPFIVSGLSDKKLTKDVDTYPSNCTILDAIDYVAIHNTGRDEDIAFVQSVMNNYSPEDREICMKILSQNFHDLGVAETTINKVWNNLIPTWEVQLAEKYYDNPEIVIGKEFTLTEKMDGFRTVALKENGKASLIARSGKRMEGFIEIEEALESFPEDNFVFDCEITIKNRNKYPSKTQYKLTSKIVSAKDPYKTGVCINAFDYLTLDEWKAQECTHKYSERRAKLDTFKDRSEFVVITEVLYSGSDVSMIEKLHTEAKEHNQEGIMINLNDAYYEFKRTKVLLKAKAFQDCDAWIDDIVEGTGKNANRLGAFKCHFDESDGNVVEFECGSGFTDADRDEFWNNKEKYIGRVCECKYFEITVNKDGKKSVRFPVFKTLKEEGAVPHNSDIQSPVDSTPKKPELIVEALF